MKNKFPYGLILIFALAFISLSFLTEKPKVREMPAEVKAAFEKACYDCHTTEATNAKAKEKLNFKSLEQLSKGQKVGKLRDIGETVKNGDMPPKKFLEKFPEKKLTAEEVSLITNWVSGETKKLLKK